jgi:hypothetical protein
MNSSTSSSEPAVEPEPAAWRRFGRTLLLTACGAGFSLYVAIVLIDPFGVLPISAPLDRAPVATNARYSFPMLARDARFDSAVIGTSTSRMLRPELLDRLFQARFANLSMNDATAYEQYRLGLVFARSRPAVRWLLIGVDVAWCQEGSAYRKLTPRPFPEWMYDDDRWNDLREHFNLYALEHAGIQLAEMVGLRRRKYGRDGYTSFLPDDALYDAARASAQLRPPAGAAEASTASTAEERRDLAFPALAHLDELLSALPRGSRALLYFVPYHAGHLPGEGTRDAAVWVECKARVARTASRYANARVADFMLASPITRLDANYWDPLHYRVAVADWLMTALSHAAAGREDEGWRLLR